MMRRMIIAIIVVEFVRRVDLNVACCRHVVVAVVVDIIDVVSETGTSILLGIFIIIPVMQEATWFRTRLLLQMLLLLLLLLLSGGTDSDDGLRVDATNMPTGLPSTSRRKTSSNILVDDFISPHHAAEDAGEGAVSQQPVHNADILAGGVARLGDGVAGGGRVTQPIRRVLSAAEGLPVRAQSL